MTILVTGSRDWNDRRRIMQRLMEEPDETTIIHGGCYGADAIASATAHALDFKVIEVRADWRTFGRNAGPIRNRKMLDMKPDRLIAFCKNNSRGTMDCVKAALERGVPVEVID